MTTRESSDENDEPHLWGVRCEDCGVVAFPVANGCIACGSLAQTTIPLSSRGRIESRTHLGERTVCEIRLEQGPLIMGWLDRSAAAEIGAVVRFEPKGSELRFVLDA